MRSTALMLAAILLSSCSTKREVVQDHYEAASVSSSYVSRDSILSSFDWVRSADTSIELIFLSAPDSTGSQHPTARATITRHVDESSNAASSHHAETVARTDSSEVKISHETSTNETKSKNPWFDLIAGAFFGSLLFLIYIKLQKQ